MGFPFCSTCSFLFFLGSGRWIRLFVLETVIGGWPGPSFPSRTPLASDRRSYSERLPLFQVAFAWANQSVPFPLIIDTRAFVLSEGLEPVPLSLPDHRLTFFPPLAGNFRLGSGPRCERSDSPLLLNSNLMMTLSSLILPFLSLLFFLSLCLANLFFPFFLKGEDPSPRGGWFVRAFFLYYILIILVFERYVPPPNDPSPQ